jgi:hypothetical protein
MEKTNKEIALSDPVRSRYPDSDSVSHAAGTSSLTSPLSMRERVRVRGVSGVCGVDDVSSCPRSSLLSHSVRKWDRVTGVQAVMVKLASDMSQ